MESVDALIKGIQEYKGGVVLVSHDARLIASTGCELWVCEGDGRVRLGCTFGRGWLRESRSHTLFSPVRRRRIPSSQNVGRLLQWRVAAVN